MNRSQERFMTLRRSRSSMRFETSTELRQAVEDLFNNVDGSLLSQIVQAVREAYRRTIELSVRYTDGDSNRWRAGMFANQLRTKLKEYVYNHKHERAVRYLLGSRFNFEDVGILQGPILSLRSFGSCSGSIIGRLVMECQKDSKRSTELAGSLVAAIKRGIKEAANDLAPTDIMSSIDDGILHCRKLVGQAQVVALGSATLAAAISEQVAIIEQNQA